MTRRSRKKRGPSSESPQPDRIDEPLGGEWCGEEFEFIAGWTEGGAPFGVVREGPSPADSLEGPGGVEARRAGSARPAEPPAAWDDPPQDDVEDVFGPGHENRPRRCSGPEHGWQLAKAVLTDVVVSTGIAAGPASVGRVRLLAQGLTYRVFDAECDLVRGGERVCERLVVRLPQADAPTPDGSDGTLRGDAQARLVERLASASFRLRLPSVLGTRDVEGGVASVETFVSGLPIDLRAGRQHDRPWEFVAEAAAACHAVDPGLMRDLLPEWPTRRDHAESEIRETAAAELPEAASVAAWAAERLPPADPPRLLHGDLLGQNLLLRVRLGPESSSAPLLGLVDWQCARIGDPAYDLAIVTRGVSRPFGVDRGLDRLLDAYARSGGAPVGRREVRLHEALLLAVNCAAEARRVGLESTHVQTLRANLRRFLDRPD